MRLVGDIEEERKAYLFYSFLSKQGIESTYEPFADPLSQKKSYHIWVYEEEQVEKAQLWLEEFKKDPQSLPFAEMKASLPPPEPPRPLLIEEPKEEIPRLKVKVLLRQRKPLSHPLTTLLIATALFLYLWNGFQEAKIAQAKGRLALQIILTPLQEELLFDYPQAMDYLKQLVLEYPLEGVKELKDLPQGAQMLILKSEETPSWKGLFSLLVPPAKVKWEMVKSVPFFEKIREGEIWRLITPVFLHRDFLHLLFNMAWLWILGFQIEERISRWKILLFILIVGVISNVAQYLMSGPLFLGFSGVVVGMAGLIWMRQTLAPWEGYPLNKATLIFILLFIIAMFVLEVVTLTLQFLGVTELAPNIANAAHVVGGLAGIGLGRLSFFARKRSTA